MSAQRRRIAVTGLGVISPLGTGLDKTWQGVVAGKSGIGPITRFDATEYATQFAGEVRDFDPTDFFSKKYVRQMDIFIQYAVACAQMAMDQAGLLEESKRPAPERIGVYVGAGLGGINEIENCVRTIDSRGPRRVSPYFVPAVIVNLAAGQISIFFNARGPSFSHVSACSTGAHSIGEAMRLIERGDVDMMICGGAESTVSTIAIGGFNAMRALSTRNDDPTKASRPFDRDRDGFVLSEGAGLMILEGWDHAERRGAEILAEAVGYAANCDAHHITSPAPEHEGAQRCMKLALADAGLEPEQVGYVNAHGTSTSADVLESKAVSAVFGAHARDGLLVSSTKSMHGHLLGAAGGLEAALCVQALREGILPPTINLDNPDPECDLDYIPHEARRVQVEYAMSNSFGFGGTNATLIFKRV